MQREMLVRVIKGGFRAKNSKEWIEKLGGEEKVKNIRDRLNSKCTAWIEDHFGDLRLTEGGAGTVLKISLGVVVRNISVIGSEFKGHYCGKYGYLTYRAKDGSEEGLMGRVFLYTMSIERLRQTLNKISEGKIEEVLRLPNTGLESLEIPSVKDEHLAALWEENILVTPRLAVFPFKPNISRGEVFNTQEIDQVYGLIESMVHRRYHNVFAALTAVQMLDYMVELSKFE